MKPKDDLDELLDKWRLRLPLGVNPAAEQTAAEQLADDAFRDVDRLVLDVRRHHAAAARWRVRYEGVCEDEERRARAKKDKKVEKKARKAKGEKVGSVKKGMAMGRGLPPTLPPPPSYPLIASGPAAGTSPWHEDTMEEAP